LINQKSYPLKTCARLLYYPQVPFHSFPFFSFPIYPPKLYAKEEVVDPPSSSDSFGSSEQVYIRGKDRGFFISKMKGGDKND
jgi:hypothetical protein